MKTEGEMLKEFMELTGADEITSRTFLVANQWNIQNAQAKLNETCRKTSSGGSKAVEDNRVNKIARGFSMVDPDLVSKFHKEIKTKGELETDETYGFFQDVTHFSFTLPDFSQYQDDFLDFLMKDLVETSTLRSLEASGHLNWWTRQNQFQRLLPLATSGDGNCLLHAASLGIWGVHDRLLNLRQAVHRTLSSDLAERTIKRRWYWYEWVKTVGQGEMVWEPTAKDWENEWSNLLSLTLPKPKHMVKRQSLSTVAEVDDNDGSLEGINNKKIHEEQYASLEEIHIFCLAHVLRRPIIVVADTMLYDFEGTALSPIHFSGVYLPVECDPKDCCRTPLVLAYCAGHFSPLVAMETPPVGDADDVPSLIVIPLVDKSLQTLPLPFAVDPGPDWNCSKQDDKKGLTAEERMSLLSSYIAVEFLNISLSGSSENESQKREEASNEDETNSKSVDDKGLVAVKIAIAKLPCNGQPEYYKELIKRYMANAKDRFSFEQETKVVESPSFDTFTIRCANDGCDMYGTVANNYLCTKCFEQQTKSLKEFSSNARAAHPSDQPPSYADAVGTDVVSSSTLLDNQLHSCNHLAPIECKTNGCSFYGTSDRNGYCSKCFNTSKL